MRLCERMLVPVEIAPRIREEGEMGGMAERFSDERMSIRASRLPEGGELTAQARGAVHREQLRLLVPDDAPAQAGDGAWVDGKLYRILCVKRWSAHAELLCEAI